MGLKDSDPHLINTRTNRSRVKMIVNSRVEVAKVHNILNR